MMQLKCTNNFFQLKIVNPDVFLSNCAMSSVSNMLIISKSPTSLKEDFKKIPEELSNWKDLK